MKYICLGGYIQSKTDSELHYIPANKLVELYGINRKECYLLESNNPVDIMTLDVLQDNKELKLLTPLFNGNYREQIKSEQSERRK